MSNQVDDSFLKVSRGAPQGVHYKQKYVPFIGKDKRVLHIVLTALPPVWRVCVLRLWNM